MTECANSSNRPSLSTSLWHRGLASTALAIVAIFILTAFGAAPTPDHFDPATHWHPGHVGDGRMGKYAEFLTAAQQEEILTRTRDYCKRFGYLRTRKM